MERAPPARRESHARARAHLERAIDAAPTLAEKALLERRMRELERA